MRRLSPRLEPGRFVYFAQFGQYLKVGCSINPVKRVASLRYRKGSCPDDLDPHAAGTLLRAIPGGMDAEFAWHGALLPLHVKGEWFRLTPEIAAWIDSIDPARGAYGQDSYPYSLADTG